ncbi:hypothetical protein ACXHQJ_11045 [Vibrio vulnificus]
MQKVSDTQAHYQIEKILTKNPNASSKYIRQRVMFFDKSTPLYSHLIPFYDQGLIDDRADIRKEIKRLISMNLGINLISRMLSCGSYNYHQVKDELLWAMANIDHIKQARQCKNQHFGLESPKDENHRSYMVMFLQKQGHRLPDIWKILNQ